jgi:ferrous iron transport protein B
MNLSELNIGDTAIIAKVRGRGAFRKRITEMGFVKGRQVTTIRTAPLNDPVEYKILGYEISLRRSEADLVEVTSFDEAKEILNSSFNGVLTEELVQKVAKEKGKIINVALVGNPNSGKTTLFNFTSNSHERVGNYSGVTVDSKSAEFKHKGYTIRITDLPGTYSLSAYSPDEIFVRAHINNEAPDIIINVIDASNLERNLYLTTQLIDMDVRIIAALNMYDELKGRGDDFDYSNLGAMVGIPFVPTISSKGIGIRDLFDKVINLYSDKDRTYRHIHINYGDEVEESIFKIQQPIKLNNDITAKISSRFLAIKLLEKDNDAIATIEKCKNSFDIQTEVDKQVRRLESLLGDDTETIITDCRYGFISGALRETLTVGAETRHKKTELIDSVLTNKFIGFPLFFAFLWFMFQVTFKLGEYPKQWIGYLVSFAGHIIDKLLPVGPLNDLLTGGIINGVGGVIVFLPNILLLFLFISFMEDTGYMARVAFIMDRLMHKIGLHGKSFIPLIMGFGCNVPAIMATRTIEGRNNRLLTILINPLMSCSARLPVYILLVSSVFPEKAGTILFLIYATGIFFAISLALIFKNTLFKTNEIPFVMELPPYRMPTLRSTFKHMWHKGDQYLKKMGGIILVASIIIWALGYFPHVPGSKNSFHKNETEIALKYDKLSKDERGLDSKVKIENDKKQAIQKNIAENLSMQQENSYIGRIGKYILPVMQPLGFDWRMSVCLLTGITAKEVIVSTMGVLYQSSPKDNNGNNSLQEKLKAQKILVGKHSGEAVFRPLTVISFLMFILIYFPCIAVMAAIRRETGTWKWPIFVVAYTTGLAWFISFSVYQIGILLGY